ncbi:whirlin-like isoform X3 [Planococcus citri]|uniref:whirlin-like isoform X3 n=1 Tax=Planococcus citri TaxID=170843 RepID=UPI0031F8DCAF
MAEEDFSDLGEVKLTHYDGTRWTSGWGRSPGSGVTTLPYQYHRTFPQSYQNNARAAEAEDIMGHHYNHTSRTHHKTGLYYSPPGTSYTIIEQPSSTMSTAHQTKYRNSRGVVSTNMAGSSSAPNSKILSNSNSNKKRPISPEQVLKLFSSHGGRNHNNNTTSNHIMNNINSSKSPINTETHAQHIRHQPPDIDKLPVKTISMTRETPPGSGNHGFGICVKGGSKKPDNVGVYISRVEEGSIAEKSGLRPGDSILEVNGIPFTNISHEEALKILKSCRQISMTIRTSPLSNRQKYGMGGWLVRQSYSWMDRMGRPVSPPPDYSKVTPTNTSERWPPSRLCKEKVELTIEPGQSLGLMIRGGLEYNLGIFVTGVDKDSVAERSGIQIGDQILDVNGTSFLDITHDEAVGHLKKHKRMTITIRDVGKIPHSFSTYDSDPSWDTQTRPHPRIPRSETIQMVEEKASSVLKKSEFATLCYYLEEYCSKRMSFETFIAVLFDLLNTQEKFTLMTELREVITPQDRSRFDDIVYRRHSLDDSRNYFNSRVRLKGDNSGRLSPNLQNLPPTQGYAKVNKFLNEQSTVPYQDTDGFRSPSEDSGLGLGPPDFANGRSSCARNAYAETGWQPESKHGPEHTSQASNEEDLGYYHQEYGDYDAESAPRVRRRSSLSDTVPRVNNANFEDDANMCGYLEGLRSQLGGWTQKVKDWYWGNPFQLAQKLGRGCDIKDDKDQKSNSKKGERSSENAAHIVPDQFGNLRITVKKTKPLLGIAIEGGANTKHPLPRIINIHENGAASEAGGLEVGQLILEVDRQKVEGMQHQAVARLIAETYANRDRKEIEFLVVEAKKSNLEPKPTALIFMDP